MCMLRYSSAGHYEVWAGSSTKDREAQNQVRDRVKNFTKSAKLPPVLASYSPRRLPSLKMSRQRVEVPGQYESCARVPRPLDHARIADFDESLLLLSSLRQPKRLTIRGTDEHDVQFLVKGGEDLRQDQRIQQLFSVMNELVQATGRPGQNSSIRLRTYRVVPLSMSVGVLEWVSNTVPLKAFIQAELVSRFGSNTPDSAANAAYKHFIEKEKGFIQVYKASRSTAVAAAEHIVSQLPWDTLRSAVLKLAATPEASLTIRALFVRSLAGINIGGYLLGIGDRHAENFLVDKRRYVSYIYFVGLTSF